ncbi:barstar family protein [Streptomyces californicus]|uniref:barstar family protein n=1 Tax=Streptomyces californicus TaxID=67351 RepID=UPI0036DD2CF3
MREQGERDRQGRGRYRLTDAEDGHVWGVCAEAEGLYGEAGRETYELVGWVPDGPEVRGWAGDRVWLVARDGTDDAWLLEDAESLGRHPGTDSLLLTGMDDYEGPPEGYRGPVRLHDGARWLGSCGEFARVLPPERPQPPFVLRELAPSERLRRALAAGTRRASALGGAWLELRDDRGAPVTERWLEPEVLAWQPSAYGADLIDLHLDGGPEPVPDHVRQVWERWFPGPPEAPGAWAGLGTRRRGAWLDLVRERGCRPERRDRPPGQAYELDGRHITDRPGLHLAIGEAVNGPGGYFGGGPDSLVDCLRGGFGHTSPATLLWRDAATARARLSRVLAPGGEPYDLFAEVLDVLTEGGIDVTLA